MDFLTQTNAIIAIITALATLAGKIGLNKLINRKSKNEILLDIVNKNTEALTELYNLIKITSDKVIIDNQMICDMCVERFSHGLKHEFIIEIYDIYVKNHLCETKTTNQLTSLIIKLINKFYYDICLIPNITIFINSKNFTLDLINKSEFSKIIYSVLIDCKQNNNSEYEIKRMLENIFDEMFGICYNTKEKK